MLQRQQCTNTTNKVQQQQEQQSGKQEHENLGDYTMDRGKPSQRQHGNPNIYIYILHLFAYRTFLRLFILTPRVLVYAMS